MFRALAALVALACALPFARAQGPFVNWESPHVHPLELTPDGSRLLAVNTPDARLEVFDLSGGTPVRLFDVPVGLDPVSVRARTAGEAWVVNHLSDSISIVDLATRRVVATLTTDDEPADVIFAGSPQRAFVSCSQANTLLVFDPASLAGPPVRIPIVGEDPRALAASPDGSRVYLAIFESGNASTVLGGGAVMNLGFPPNVVSDPAGPWGGQNPPPNQGSVFEPPLNTAIPAPPKVGLIVKKDATGRWKDDNGGNWTSLVSGGQAAKSGRPVGWDLADHDLAVVDTSTLAVSYVRRLMNIGMALGVNPANGEVTLVGTDATNEERFEPNLKGRFLRVQLARVDGAGTAALGIVDLNPHLDYQVSNVPQVLRERSIGDPRGIAWNAAGTRGYVSGMGSSNVVVVDAAGARVGLAPAIEVGEGPTGVALDEPRGLLYVLDKFESALSVVSLASELEILRLPFHDASPAAIRVGRKHLYDTHRTSGLGHIACASCHVDARMDRLSWDLGDPAGSMKSVAGQNFGSNIPGLNTGFQNFHPMKGPMTTQSLQDIIGREPLHWRGDRDGLEEFSPAFVGLQGDDASPSAAEMQEFEDFLATITYPPNPYRNFDNTLPTQLPLPGFFSPGRFSPKGTPLPDGNAVAGLAAYRPPSRLDGGIFACVTCHTLPVGIGSDSKWNGSQFVPIAPGPNGERHHALVSVDGSTNISVKVPQLRNLYEKTGFDTSQLVNTAGAGLLHDGSIDTIPQFVAEPVFTVTGDQMIADLTAFLLSFSGSELPQGSPTSILEPPGTQGKDSHAAVGAQTTLVDAASPAPGQLARIASMLALADAGKVGVVVHGSQAGIARGYAYLGGGSFQSDRAAQTLTAVQLQASAAPGSELTYSVVPKGSETRLGLDRDLDSWFDRDELDLGTDPADANSHPGGCTKPVPSAPTSLSAVAVGPTQINLSWVDTSSIEDGFSVERAPKGSSSFAPLASLPPDTTSWPDATVACGTEYDYRVRAFDCAGPSGFAAASAASGPCCPAPSSYCIAAPNSAGSGAMIGSSGTTSVSANDLTLEVAGAPGQAFGLFYYGASAVQAPFGDGWKCVGAGGAGIFRLPVLKTAASGAASWKLDLNAPPSPAGTITAGSTWHFQFWYRDVGGPLGSGFNLSDALTATFCP